MDRKEMIEIPFGAKDSELKGWEYTIPEGMEAVIQDGKVIVREKESEDERIRKWLIQYIKDTHPIANYWNGAPNIPDVLAWLEKKKEQKVDIDKLRKDIYQSGYNDGYQHGKEDAQKEQNVIPSRETILGIWELGNIWKENPEERDGLTQLQYIQKYWNEKCDYQIEQKAAKWSEEDEKMLYFVNQFLEYHEASDQTAKSCKEWFNNRLKSLRPQPKQEWSEEDKIRAKMLEHFKSKTKETWCNIPVLDIISWLEHVCVSSGDQLVKWSEEDKECINGIVRYLEASKNPEDTYGIGEIDYYVSWLKSLRTYSKIEWTEEDDEKRNRAISYLSDWIQDHIIDKDGVKDVEAIKSWLSKLAGRPCDSCWRPNWKPSEEQMEALKETISQDCAVCNGDRKWIKPNLESLYEQLKAL